MIKANEPKTNDYEFQYDIKMRYEISLALEFIIKQRNIVGYLISF